MFENVDFSMAPGRCTFLVGESGEGKTTILSLLLQFIAPSAGRILVDGKPLAETPPDAWRRQIAWIGQEPRLFSGTIRENICLGSPEASGAQIQAAADAALVTEFLPRLAGGLDEQVGEGGRLLSRGQAQRVALARALLVDASVLLLDEPLAGLDAQTEAAVSAALKRLSRKKSVLWVTHRFGSVDPEDRLLILSGGRIREQAGADDSTGCYTACHHNVPQEKLRHKGLQQKTVPEPEWFFDNPYRSGVKEAGGPAAANRRPFYPTTSIKALIKEIRPFLSPFAGHLRAMVLATGLAVAAVGAAVGLLALAGWFITAAALAGVTAAGAAGFNFFYPSIGVRILAVGRTLARYGERIFSHDATFRILSDLRSEFYRRIEPLAPAGLLRFQSADILQRVVGDIDTLDHLYLRLVSPCAVAVFTALGLAALLGLIGASVALCGVSVFVAAAVGVSLLSGRLGSAAGWKMNAAAAALRVQVVEGIQAMGELLVFGAHRRYLKRIGRGGAALLSAQRSANRTAATASALVSLCAGIGALAVLWPACRLVAAGRIDPAVAALAVFATLAAFEAVLSLPGAFQHLGRTRAAARRLCEVLDFKAQTAFVEDSGASPAAFDLFFESVRFRYAAGRSPVLDGFSLHIPEARRLVLMGTTGAGKSTLVHLLCRYWDPDGGRIRIGDADINKLSEPKLRQTLSVVSQRDHVFSATLRENLTLARPDASDQKLYETIETAGLGELVRGLPRGLDTWIGEGGRGLSGGQARRLFIARAMLRDAPIWVLDEPTEGLDRKTEEAVFESLFHLTEGRTVLVITHRPVMLERFDRAAVLENGRIAEIGNHRSLLAAGGRYAELAKGL